MKKSVFFGAMSVAVFSISAVAGQNVKVGHEAVSDKVIAEQRQQLAESTLNKGFGPQSPRDIDLLEGNNRNAFAEAPAYQKMNLCNIHFHAGAEHKGGEFTQYAGNGDGKGYSSGYLYSGALSKKQKMPLKNKAICAGNHGSLSVGDTIEAHYVHSTAPVSPGPTLGACLATNVVNNPQLRVEAQVYLLVNDGSALDFRELAAHDTRNGFYQALNIPENTGTPIKYAGSTTGPNFNTLGSPFQVTWSLRPKVAFVDSKTVGQWCRDNVFNEGYAHGVRNLIINPDLLSDQ